MDRMKHVFENYVKEIMKEYEAPGIAVSIIDKNNTVYENYFGYRNKEKKLTLNQDTIFGLASITKSFTCLAIMQIAAEGKIDINADVSNYIPEFKNKNQQPVKIHHLMSHCAGYFPLPRILVEDIATKLGIFETVDGDLAYSDKLATEGVKLVAERLDAQEKMIGKPGELMSYSNDSYGLLADIIRNYGGEKSYSDYINNRILKPLGMTRSSCEFVSVRENDNSTCLYIHRNGLLTESKDFYDNAFVLMGGGAMKSTISDMKKYLSMYINNGVGNGNEIIDWYSIKEMSKPRQVYRHQQYYGYGLSINHIGDITTIGHGGSLTGVSTQFAWSPELEMGVIVLCNTSGVPTSAIADAAIKWCAGICPTEPNINWIPMQWDEKTINSACGKYISGEGAVITISKKENGIAIDISGEDLPIIMVLPHLAVVTTKMTKSELRLYKNRNGDVWGIGYGGRIIPRA